jgi:hypothetical protein
MLSFSDLAAIGSFVSGVAVAVTVVFLILQLRQNARATASSAMGTWLGDYNNMLLRVSTDPEFEEMIRNGLTDFAKLTLNDQARFHTYMSLIELNAIYLFKQRKVGAFDPDFADQVLGFTAAILKMKGGQQWWATMRQLAEPEFQTYMDELIETATAAHTLMPWFASDGPANNSAD